MKMCGAPITSAFGLALATLSITAVPDAWAQTAATQYSWTPAGVQDWFRNFGAASTSATLSNPGGAFQIVETSAAAGGSQAFTDGFNTIRDTGAPFAAWPTCSTCAPRRRGGSRKRSWRRRTRRWPG